MNENEKNQPTVIMQTPPGAVAQIGLSARDTIGALSTQPILLVIVILNMMMIGTGGWFFLKQEEYRHEERIELVKLLMRCDFQPVYAGPGPDHK